MALLMTSSSDFPVPSDRSATNAEERCWCSTFSKAKNFTRYTLYCHGRIPNLTDRMVEVRAAVSPREPPRIGSIYNRTCKGHQIVVFHSRHDKSRTHEEGLCGVELWGLVRVLSRYSRATAQENVLNRHEARES